MKQKGWRNESARHGLAAKGVKTKDSYNHVLEIGRSKGIRGRGIHQALYNELRRKYEVDYPHEVPYEDITKTGKEMGLANNEIALFIIGYVGDQKFDEFSNWSAKEYVEKKLGYDYSIDTYLDAMNGRK